MHSVPKKQSADNIFNEILTDELNPQKCREHQATGKKRKIGTRRRVRGAKRVMFSGTPSPRQGGAPPHSHHPLWSCFPEKQDAVNQKTVSPQTDPQVSLLSSPGQSPESNTAGNKKTGAMYI